VRADPLAPPPGADGGGAPTAALPDVVAVNAATEVYGGGSPLPHFQPSTSPSCTRVLLAPARDVWNVDVPDPASKYAQ
jgi:hypothetical protein